MKKEKFDLHVYVDQASKQKSKNKKDVWDKLASISGFISGGLIALVGLYVTHSFNQQQLESQKILREKEISITKIETIEKFFPHISSEDKNARKMALISISALDESLAIDMAKYLCDKESLEILTKLSKSEEKHISEKAKANISNIMRYVKNSSILVISFYKNQGSTHISRTNGFFISNNGYLITLQDEKPDSMIAILNGDNINSKNNHLDVELIKHDEKSGLLLAKIKEDLPVHSLILNDDYAIGDTVYGIYSHALPLSTNDKEEINYLPMLQTGYIDSLIDNNILTTLPYYTGQVAGVAVNIKGEAIGVVYGVETYMNNLKIKHGLTRVVSGSTIKNFLNNLNIILPKEPNKSVKNRTC